MSNPDTPDMNELARKIAEMSTSASGNVADQLTKNSASAMQSADPLAKAQSDYGQRPPLSVRITVENARAAFTYAPWDQEQVDAGKQVTEALIAAAETILRVVPESPRRTRAIDGLFDARMLANAAITHRGKF